MMNKHKGLDQLLDDWVDNKINLEEVNHLSNIHDRAKVEHEAQLHKLAIEAVVQYGLARQVANVHAAFTNPTVIPLKGREHSIGYWAVRVAAFLVLALSTLFATQKWLPTTQTVYNDTFQEYYLGNERGLTIEKTVGLESYFKLQNFKQVTSVYEQIDIPTQKEKFLAGYAYLVTDRLLESIGLLERVLANNRNTGIPLYQDDAEYYLALAYLKNKEVAKAKLLLQSIYNNPAHTYHDNINNFDLNILKWFY